MASPPVEPKANLHANLRFKREQNLVCEHVGECYIPTRTLEWSHCKLQKADQVTGVEAYVKKEAVSYHHLTHDHFVNKNSQGPPIHGRGVPCAVDYLRGDVLYMSRGCQWSDFSSNLCDNRRNDSGGMATHLQSPRRNWPEYLLCMPEYPEWGPDQAGSAKKFRSKSALHNTYPILHLHDRGSPTRLRRLLRKVKIGQHNVA